MIKKILLAVALAIPMLVSAQSLKVGVVDTNVIMQAMPDTKTAETKLADTSKKYEDEFAKLQQEMARLYEEFQKMPENEPQAIKERKMRELTDMQQKIETFNQTASQDLQRMQQELMQPIVAKIKNAIESVGKENGYSLIQESAAVIYYGAPVDDITAKVKAKLGVN
ncbi:MAG: OmpH family outer membrane protein [Muribaculaceae bacterium]|nr:OmpH family outer membrane protein [Muribaculaceae bacterium]MDE6027882.1 OmpH family outer membrane protein [Muribaculaceae bacterium]